MDSAPNVAVFCDFENVAIGVSDARYERFDINLVLERILEKGKVVFKKAYADWDRFKASKRAMHEASFELVEIPHVSISGKNSADIRLVVDALDLSYTKEHVDIFVIVSGDSDFSPLVSKLRENGNLVIGLGVKNSSSDLLIENCDEFIYYDDLVRSQKPVKKNGSRRKKRPRKAKKTQVVRGEAREKGSAPGTVLAPPEQPEANVSAADASGDPEEALELVLETVEALFRDRDGNVWGSMIKQVIKRKLPQFSESYFGYSSFNSLLEDARDHELLVMRLDEKSGNYVIQGFGPKA